MGGAKGGSDFDPKGRSAGEVRRFCQSFMTELYRHIGQFTDVPAGDIGVGGREIGYLFGQYKRITNQFSGVLTGKGLEWGGRPSARRRPATAPSTSPRRCWPPGTTALAGKTCLVSGSGQRGPVHGGEADRPRRPARDACPTPAASSTTPTASTGEKLDWVMDLKNVRRGRIRRVRRALRAVPVRGRQPAGDANPLWSIPADCAFPSATQNEINGKDAANLVAAGVIVVTEGANMPTTPEGAELFIASGVLYGPGKAANAGGVAVSCLEMAQDSEHLQWSREQVDERLRSIMSSIHARVERRGRGVRPARQLRARGQHRRVLAGSPTPCWTRTSYSHRHGEQFPRSHHQRLSKPLAAARTMPSFAD